jgi:hypothetical protein
METLNFLNTPPPNHKNRRRQNKHGDQKDKSQIKRDVNHRQKCGQIPAQGERANRPVQNAGKFPESGQMQNQKYRTDGSGALEHVLRGQKFSPLKKSVLLQEYFFHCLAPVFTFSQSGPSVVA